MPVLAAKEAYQRRALKRNSIARDMMHFNRYVESPHNLSISPFRMPANGRIGVSCARAIVAGEIEVISGDRTFKTGDLNANQIWRLDYIGKTVSVDIAFADVDIVTLYVFDQWMRPRAIAKLNAGVTDFTWSSTALPIGWSLTRSDTGWAFNNLGVLTSYGVDVPRWNYNGATLALEGLLNEPARTNVSIQANAFETWTNGGTYVVANQATGPDGLVSADKYKAANVANPQVYRSATLPDATLFAWSFFGKRDPSSAKVQDLHLIPQGVVTLSAVRFNMADGTSVISTGTVNGKGADLSSNGFFRCWVADTTSAAGTGYHQLNLVDPGQNTIAVPDANSGCFIAFAQLEIASDGKPSSPIPTTTVAVTRPADVLTCTIDNGTYTIDIERLSGTTQVVGHVVAAGSYTVPTSTSPLRKITFTRTA